MEIGVKYINIQYTILKKYLICSKFYRLVNRKALLTFLNFSANYTYQSLSFLLLDKYKLRSYKTFCKLL